MTFPQRPVTQLLGSNGPVHALSYSSSPSTYILTGSADRTVRLYNPNRQTSSSSNPLAPKPTQLIQSYSAHGYAVLDIDVAHDNATFASCGGDRNVFLWDVTTAQTICRFGANSNQGHTARVNTVSFGGAGDSVLVSGGFDARVRVWDIKSRSGKPVMVLEDAKDSVSCVLVGGGGDRRGGKAEYEIVAGSVDGRVRYYDIRMGKLETDVIGASVTSLARTRDGKGVLVGALDSTIRLMDRDGGGLLKAYKADGPEKFKNDEFRLRSCFGGNEKWVLSGNEDVKGDDGEVVVWDTLTGKITERVRITGSSDTGKKKIGRDGKEQEKTFVISCLAWKEDGRGDQWCCAGTDGIVTVFGS
ncbi:WD40-repeat-containing domain protein [Xylogone sp. PMI_703]|nr:WD40-repeat-containing domain protein [Xylogone sp. PMI_703]